MDRRRLGLPFMTQAELTVPETALITLYYRASEARRPDGIIDDPMAIQLTESIDFDFGQLQESSRQDVALRALAFDTSASEYLSRHPKATVVALGEGLQTSFWRADAAGLGHEFRWLSVDLPPNIKFRERLLPSSDRVSMCAQSALDFSWMDRVDPQHGVFVTAEGLLPYFEPDEALALIGECARRFPGGQMMFDLPPMFQARLSRHRMRTTPHGGWPATPFSLTGREVRRLSTTVAGVRAVHELPLPRGRGPLFEVIAPKARPLPVTRLVRHLIGIKFRTIAKLVLLEFDSDEVL
jgi:O-methyltransferase involved in polyketide biosynthesis